MAVAYMALGANLGDPVRQVRGAMDALDAMPGMHVLARSCLYRTPPWGVREQPPFINAVVCVDVDLTPHAVLKCLQTLEADAGRVRDGQRWGPRLLDLDLLMQGEQTLDEPDLQLPHPRMAERAFVLLPLADIAADLVIPGRGCVRELLRGVDATGCERLDQGA